MKIKVKKQPNQIEAAKNAAAAAATPASEQPTILTHSQLVYLLSGRKGATLATLVSRTIPEMNKNIIVDGVGKQVNPMLGRLEKLSRSKIVINWKYENAVNNQRMREGTAAGVEVVMGFVAEPRKWGVRLDDSPFVENKGQLYLEAKVEKSLEHQFILDGKPVADSVVEAYIKPKAEGSGRQEVEKAVILRDYKLASIEQLFCDGKVYLIDHAASLPAVEEKPEAIEAESRKLPIGRIVTNKAGTLSRRIK